MNHFTIEGMLIIVLIFSIPQKYVDNISVFFFFFNSPEHLKRFKSYLSFCHVNMSFTIENKKDNRIFFCDLIIIYEQSLPITNKLLAELSLTLTIFYHSTAKLT